MMALVIVQYDCSFSLWSCLAVTSKFPVTDRMLFADLVFLNWSVYVIVCQKR